MNPITDNQTELDLFSLPGKTQWTRAVPDFDLLPKFHFSNSRRFTEIAASEVLERSFEMRGEHYKVELSPAHIVQGKDSFFAFPGEREELVLRALRYLAVQTLAHMSEVEIAQQGICIKIAFTMAQLQAHLASWRHTFSVGELDEALLILARTSFQITQSGTKNALFSASLISEYSYKIADTDPIQASLENGAQMSATRYVILNSMESAAIKGGSYYALNFQRIMRLSSPLARAIFELLMLRHRGADKPPVAGVPGPTPKPFKLRLEDVLTYIRPEKQLRNTLGRIRSALKQLQKQGVLWAERPFDEFLEYDNEIRRGRKRIRSVVWHLYLSREDVSDMIASHTEAVPITHQNMPPKDRAKFREHCKKNL